MDSDSPQARIEHERAELHALYPQLSNCDTMLVRWGEPAGSRYSLRLDIRWPDHQTLVSGPAKDSAAAAVEAGFRSAREQIDRYLQRKSA